MYGRYHFHLHKNPAKRLVYGVLGGPRISDWIRFWNVSRALKGLDAVSTQRILDAGCGLGFYSLMLAEKFPRAVVTSVDDDPALAKKFQETALSMGMRSIEVSRQDLTKYEPGQTFNLICCVDVLEHIVNHDTAFNNFARWLAPGGRLILHVPQKNQKFWFIKRTHGGDDPHCREGYDLKEMTELLESRGLKVIASRNTFDRMGAAGVELDEILWKSRLYPLWLLFYPLFMAMAVWDVRHQGNQGQGLLVVAVKNV
jgi:trans-aconitate methyltransferase